MEILFFPLGRSRSYFIPDATGEHWVLLRYSCGESDTIVTMTPALGCGIIVEKNTDQMHARRENTLTVSYIGNIATFSLLTFSSYF